MNDGRVSAWAAPFVDPENDEPMAVQRLRSTGTSRLLMPGADELRAECRTKANKHTERSKINLIRALVLFVVSQWPHLPTAVHWIAFFGSMICGAIALDSWNEAMTSKAQATLFTD